MVMLFPEMTKVKIAETRIELKVNFGLGVAESGVFVRYLRAAVQMKMRNADLNFSEEVEPNTRFKLFVVRVIAKERGNVKR